ncbi:ASCH domain-containing protein [Cytobacillus sp. Hz8]|uniref:ASCH domain-containing protein n=1 Tax=Cytobacillus sp. Hz8 TaxID=3347168 RepID=UPI0035E04393
MAVIQDVKGEGQMKVISVKQPWATLIALGEKSFETRSWQTNFRGEVAIHASKNIDRMACQESLVIEVLHKHGFILPHDLPLGMILATCQIVNCFEVREDLEDSALLYEGLMVSGNEYHFGDYRKGRYAWKLCDVKMLNEPIAAKGKLGLWNYD